MERGRWYMRTCVGKNCVQSGALAHRPDRSLPCTPLSVAKSCRSIGAATALGLPQCKVLSQARCIGVPTSGQGTASWASPPSRYCQGSSASFLHWGNDVHNTGSPHPRPSICQICFRIFHTQIPPSLRGASLAFTGPRVIDSCVIWLAHLWSSVAGRSSIHRPTTDGKTCKMTKLLLSTS